MSDYISKSALIEEFYKRIDGDLDIFEVEYLEKVVNGIPTIDEKEIIRKTVERVVEMLEENGQKMSEAKAIRPYAKHSPADHRYYKAISVKKAIEIVKEECGINE